MRIIVGAIKRTQIAEKNSENTNETVRELNGECERILDNALSRKTETIRNTKYSLLK